MKKNRCWVAVNKEWNKKGKCCCNCEWRVRTYHRWDDGRQGLRKGYACMGLFSEGERAIYPSNPVHGLCEMHHWRKKNAEDN